MRKVIIVGALPGDIEAIKKAIEDYRRRGEESEIILVDQPPIKLDSVSVVKMVPPAAAECYTDYTKKRKGHERPYKFHK